MLLLGSFVLDCADGQLARYSLRYSTLGAWLDATFDRAKEYAFYAGLALGAARTGDDVWALALGAIILQSCRHVVDFSFAEARTGAADGPAAALSGRLDRVGWTVWVRRMIVLPIGERWALIAVLTAATTPASPSGCCSPAAPSPPRTPPRDAFCAPCAAAGSRTRPPGPSPTSPTADRSASCCPAPGPAAAWPPPRSARCW